MTRQSQPSLFAQVVPVQTGRNGYEEYLRAGDVVGEDGWGVYETWMAYLRGRLRPPPGADGDQFPRPPIPELVTDSMPDLEVRRVAVSRLGDAIGYIKQGNEKEVFDPRNSVSSLTKFPEYARFKAVAKLISSGAHVAFADGNSDAATKDLLAGLEFARKLPGTTLISCLVGIAMEAIILAEFNEHLSQISLSDAELVDKYCNQAIQESTMYGSTLSREADQLKADLDQYLEHPDLVLFGDSLKMASDALKDLSSTDRQSLKDSITRSIDARFTDASLRLSGPESGWLATSNARDPAVTPGRSALANCEILFENALCGRELMTSYAKAMAKARIQLRLLQLHMKVLEFHWKNSVWPISLAEFADSTTSRDPFAKGSFHYNLKDSSYELYSMGIPGIGRLELKYHSQASAASSSPADPGNP